MDRVIPPEWERLEPGGFVSEAPGEWQRIDDGVGRAALDQGGGDAHAQPGMAFHLTPTSAQTAWARVTAKYDGEGSGVALYEVELIIHQDNLAVTVLDGFDGIALETNDNLAVPVGAVVPVWPSEDSRDGDSASKWRFCWPGAGGAPAPPSYTSTVTAAGTTTLTAASTTYQYFTGTNTETVQMPVVSTLELGTTTYVVNRSTQPLTVTSSGGSTITTVAPGQTVTLVSVATTGTTATSWDYYEAGTTPTGSLIAGSFVPGYTTTATAAGTTTLTAASTQQQFFTGTLTHTAQLPVTSTMILGYPYRIVNDSTAAVTVQSSGGNTVVTLAAGTSAIVTCVSTSGTGASSWEAQVTAGSSLPATPGTPATLAAVPTWYLVATITDADLTDADTSQDLTVYTLPAKAGIYGGLLVPTTAFSGGGVVSPTAKFRMNGSDLGGVSQAGTANDVSGVVNGPGGTNGPTKAVQSWTATTAIIVQFNTGSGNLVSLTAGSMRVLLCLAQLG